MSNALGAGVCEVLLGLHAFTGCDSVSSFVGKGKLSALQLVKKNEEYQDLFSAFGITWDIIETVFKQLQMFTCALYGAKNAECDINAPVQL